MSSGLDAGMARNGPSLLAKTLTSKSMSQVRGGKFELHPINLDWLARESKGLLRVKRTSGCRVDQGLFRIAIA